MANLSGAPNPSNISLPTFSAQRDGDKSTLAPCTIGKQFSRHGSGLVGTGSLVRDFRNKILLITSSEVISSTDLSNYFFWFKKADGGDKRRTKLLDRMSDRMIFRTHGLAIIPVDPRKFSFFQRWFSGLLKHRPLTIYPKKIKREDFQNVELLCHVVQEHGETFSIKRYMVKGIADEETYLADLNGRKMETNSCFGADSNWKGLGAPITMICKDEVVAVGALNTLHNNKISVALFSEINWTQVPGTWVNPGW